MGHTRAAVIKETKFSEQQLIDFIKDVDAKGIPMYMNTAVALTSKKTVAKLIDNGTLTYTSNSLGHMVHVAEGK